MKKIFKIFAAVLCAGVIATPCVATPVFANSGPMRESGVTALGTVTIDGKSALAVESEILTFDIDAFPYKEGQPEDARSTVTAEYKFVNTSANVVHTTMAFPMEGSLPYYLTDNGGEKVHDYGETEITVDGKKAELRVRHTLGSYSDFKESVAKISDDYYQTDFYKPETAVTKLSVAVDLKNYDSVYCVGEVKFLSDGARVACADEDGEINLYFSREYSGAGEVYIIGDPSAVKISWHAEVYNSRKYGYESVNLPIEVQESKTTLAGMLKETKGEREAISDLDWYNAVVRCMEASGRDIQRREIEPDTSDFIEWYVYDVTVQPNGSVENSVKAPIYPTVYYNYEPYVYKYSYLLSPASCWADFGSLKVRVNTGYYLRNDEDSVQLGKTEVGYTAEFSSLPDKEITFSLCEAGKPEVKNLDFTYFVLVLLIIILLAVAAVGIAGVTVAIVYLKKHSKKQ